MGRTKMNLRREQPHLWRRILALAITFLVLGFPLLFAPSPATPTANVSIMQELLELKYHGVIFMTIGFALLVGAYNHNNAYRIARVTLSIALGYSIAWLLSLLYGAFFYFSGAAIVGLWGFFTYIINNTLHDPGFLIADLIREVRKHHDV